MNLSLVPSRATLSKLLALVGLAIVAVEIYVFSIPPVHILILAFGVLIMYVGALRFAGQISGRRINTVLRSEIGYFVSLVRQLYIHRTNGNSAGMQETKEALRQSVERIIRKAAAVHQEKTKPIEEEGRSAEAFTALR